MFGIDDYFMASAVPSIFSAASTLLPSLLSYQGQQDTNAQNAEQAELNRQFQANMSNTAYQRATADMKAAGLNPMLAYSQGGASSPSGAVATMGNSLGAAVNTGMAAQRLQPEISLIKGQAEQAEAGARKADSERIVNQALLPKIFAETTQAQNSAAQSEMTTRVLEATLPKLAEEVRNLAVGRGLTEAQTARERQQTRIDREMFPAAYADVMGRARVHDATRRETEARIGLHGAQTAYTRGQTGLLPLIKQGLSLDIPRRQNEASMEDSWYGRAKAYLPSLGTAANGAWSIFNMMK